MELSPNPGYSGGTR